MSALETQAVFHVLTEGDMPTMSVNRYDRDGTYWLRVVFTCPPDDKHTLTFFGTPEQVDEIEGFFTARGED